MSAKVTYFNMAGLGEPVRLILAASNIPFQDVRVNKEEWAALKPTLRWPHLPMLEIDGQVLFQSRAICRYVARKSGLAGSDNLEAALADMTVDTLDDMRHQIVRHYYLPDSAARDEGLVKASTELVPLYLDKLEEQVGENNGYLVKGKMSWADVMLLAYSDYLSFVLGKDLLAGYPALAQIATKVSRLPGVSQYLADRPDPPADLRTLFM